MLASIPSAVLFGARGHRVTVEVHVAWGFPAFNIVGLPDESIREARDRVRAAVMSSGQPWPSQKITVNLAPSRIARPDPGSISRSPSACSSPPTVDPASDRRAGVHR